jgi:hypothetical protein
MKTPTIQESESEAYRRKEAKRTHLHYGVKERREALLVSEAAHVPVEVLPEPSAPVEQPSVESAPEAPVQAPVAE